MRDFKKNTRNAIKVSVKKAALLLSHSNHFDFQLFLYQT